MNKIDKCIIFSTADWDTPYWTNKQHTAIHIAGKGIQVLYIESIGLRKPKLTSYLDIIRICRRFFKFFRGINQVQNNLYVLSPLVIPFKHHWYVIRLFNRTLLRALINYFINRNIKKKSNNTIIWTYHPYALDMIPKNGDWPVIYHCVDDLSSVPGIEGKTFNVVESNFLVHADLVFTTSKTLYEKCKQYSDKVINYPNVVDFEHFCPKVINYERPRELLSIPRPLIGYVGVLSDFKIDFKLLYEVVILTPSYQYIFIGDEREGQSNKTIAKLRLEPNAHFLGYKKYAELPMLMSYLDVGILPSLINSYTKSMFPMKYYEYIAAGIPVVSTPLDFLLKDSNCVLVGEDAESFVEAIKKQLKNGKINRQQAEIIIGDNTWEKRLDKMLNSIKGLK